MELGASEASMTYRGWTIWARSLPLPQQTWVVALIRSVKSAEVVVGRSWPRGQGVQQLIQIPRVETGHSTWVVKERQL